MHTTCFQVLKSITRGKLDDMVAVLQRENALMSTVNDAFEQLTKQFESDQLCFARATPSAPSTELAECAKVSSDRYMAIKAEVEQLRQEAERMTSYALRVQSKCKRFDVDEEVNNDQFAKRLTDAQKAIIAHVC